jgi:diketogulonate reductase-like aldo/keto reductase
MIECPLGSIPLSNGSAIPKLGLGCHTLGNDPRDRDREVAAISAALESGRVMFDTAESYGNGLSETFLGESLKSMDRAKLFLVSKVTPSNAGRVSIFKSCAATLSRLQMHYLDLYLLHWRSQVPLCEIVECMEQLVREGKIRMWGVSNFDVADMERLWRVPGGDRCVANQVQYSLACRGIEFDLLPWMKAHGVVAMAYGPVVLALDVSYKSPPLLANPLLTEIAAKHGLTVVQLLLLFVCRNPIVAAIPRSKSAEHVRQNCQALKVALAAEEWDAIDREFPPPTSKTPLETY